MRGETPAGGIAEPTSGDCGKERTPWKEPTHAEEGRERALAEVEGAPHGQHDVSQKPRCGLR